MTLAPLNAISVSGVSYPITPFLKNFDEHLEQLPKALINLQVQRCIESLSSSWFSSISEAFSSPTPLSPSVLTKISDAKVDYTSVRKRKETLFGIRHGIKFSDDGTSFQRYRAHNYDPLVRWGLLDDNDVRTLNAINNFTATKNTFKPYGKYTHFLLKKFPYYPICEMLENNIVSRKDHILLANDFECAGAGLDIAPLYYLILNMCAAKFDVKKGGIQSFPSRCGEYQYLISKSNNQILTYYYAFVVAKKICIELGFKHLVIPPVKMVDINLNNKTYTVVVQKKIEGNTNTEHQRQCRRNAQHLLDNALKEYIKLNEILGIKMITKEGDAEDIPMVLKDYWDLPGKIVIENFAINPSIFFRENDDNNKDTIRYRVSLFINLRRFYNKNTINIFKENLSKPILEILERRIDPSIIKQNEEEEARYKQAEAFYLKHNTEKKYLRVINAFNLYQEKVCLTTEGFDAYWVIHKIDMSLIQNSTKDYEFLSDKRRLFLKTSEEEFAKTGAILTVLKEKEIIPAFYPENLGYVIYA